MAGIGKKKSSTSHFLVAFCLRVKTSLCETTNMKMSSAFRCILMQIKLISHLDRTPFETRDTR